MSAILLPAPSTATPTLQRLNSRSMLRNLSSSDDHALARKTHHHRHHEGEHAESSHWLAPPLAPKVMEPERHSKAADATVRLQRIEYVEVADVIQREGDNKHYYVVHVYLKQEQSRIPTNQSRFQRVLRSGHHEARRTPDFTIERRFSEFEQLRKEMWTTVQHSHRHYCTFCDSFMFLLLFSSAQPGVLAKTVLKSPEMRAKLLDKFLHNVVDQFQRNRPRCRIACYSLGHLPLVLHDFLFGGDEHEPRASVVSDTSDASVDPTE